MRHINIEKTPSDVLIVATETALEGAKSVVRAAYDKREEIETEMDRAIYLALVRGETFQLYPGFEESVALVGSTEVDYHHFTELLETALGEDEFLALNKGDDTNTLTDEQKRKVVEIVGPINDLPLMWKRAFRAAGMTDEVAQ